MECYGSQRPFRPTVLEAAAGLSQCLGCHWYFPYVDIDGGWSRLPPHEPMNLPRKEG